MSYESLYTLDRSIIFRETFNNSYSVQNNGYTRGTINGTPSFNNNSIKLNNPDYIQYNTKISGTFSVRIITTLYNLVSANRYVFDLRSNTGSGSSYLITQDISTLIASGIKVYINGIQTPTTTFVPPLNKKIEIIIVGISCIRGIIRLNKFWNALNSGISQNIDLFEIYNSVITEAETKLLYQQRNYSSPIEIPLLLDFDSTRGILEDRTGKNSLTINNVITQQIGKVKSAYFNNNGTILVPHNNSFNQHNFVINFWFKPATTKSSGIAPGCQDITSKNYTTSWTLPYAIFRLYTDTTNTFFIQLVRDAVSLYTVNTGYIMKYNIFTNFIIIFYTKKILVYINGKFFNIFTGGNVAGTGHTGEFLTLDLTNSPFSNQGINIGINPVLGTPLRGNLTKYQLFQGVPDNSNLFAAQLYNSQKGQFGL